MIDLNPPSILRIRRKLRAAIMLLVLTLTPIGLNQCSLFKSSIAPETPATPRQQLVGKVASVSEPGQFVLIQSYQDRRIPEGAILTTRGSEERTANLYATGETLGQFTAADIRAGTVAKNDPVFYTPPTAKNSLSPTENAERQVVDPVSESLAE